MGRHRHAAAWILVVSAFVTVFSSTNGIRPVKASPGGLCCQDGAESPLPNFGSVESTNVGFSASVGSLYSYVAPDAALTYEGQALDNRFPIRANPFITPSKVCSYEASPNYAQTSS